MKQVIMEKSFIDHVEAIPAKDQPAETGAVMPGVQVIVTD